MYLFGELYIKSRKYAYEDAPILEAIITIIHIGSVGNDWTQMW